MESLWPWGSALVFLVTIFLFVRDFLARKNFVLVVGRSLGSMRFNRNVVSFLEYSIAEKKYIAPFAANHLGEIAKDSTKEILIDPKNPANCAYPFDDKEFVDYYGLFKDGKDFHPDFFRFTLVYVFWALASLATFLFFFLEIKL